MKELLMGNEAVGLGALLAGVKVVAGYPGTPSTEVLETIAKRNPGSVHVEWSVNEKAGLEGLTVNTIARLKNRYYVGTDQGIRIYDKNWNEKENQLTDMLQQIRVRHILPDSSGRVWIATYSSFGAVCYDPKNGEITCYSEAEGLRSNSVRTLLELSDGTIAVGTQNGANLIHDGAITASFGSEDGM